MIWFACRKKVVLTDEQVLRALGAEETPVAVAQSLDEIANAATFMKKFIDGKKPPPQATTKPGFPGSVLYVGSLKARLSKTDADISKDIKDISKNPAMSTTVFLGKMISRKDKQGLIRGGSNNSDEEVESYKDNPVFLALEKVKMRQQTSLDSDSRAASRTSHIRQQLEIYCTYILIVMPLLELC